MHPILKSHCETGHFSQGYLLVGDPEKSRISGREAAAILLNCSESSLDSHPDFSEHFFDFFDLEESNNLKQKFSMKPALAERKVFLLGISSFDRLAIAGLSKILEDPPESCYSFFMTKFAGDFPLSFRSRLVNLFEGKIFELSDEKRNFYEKFLKTEAVERFSLAKSAASDKRIALEFLNELEIILNEKLEKEIKSSAAFKGILSSLEEIEASRQFLFDRAPSARMIIEHFVLTLPRLK